jgi:predicted nucleic-acid-binding Zn-ribbon protein
MKNGKCPQCGSTTVHSQRGGLNFGNLDRIFVNAANKHSPSTYTTLVCTTCGYVEIYLTEKSYLEDVAKTWPKVPFSG